MCPMCWATALTSYATLLAVSVAVLAGTDALSVLLASALAVLGLLHRADWLAAPWWLFAVGMVLAILRVAVLAVRSHDELIVTRAWSRARRIAAGRCPSTPAPLETQNAEA